MFSILIVDDDKIIRMGLKKIIESNMKEFEVVGEASNGIKALEIIREVKPDILITDIKMPVMDGIELITNINKLTLKTRYIVLSGFDDYKYIRETFKNGAVDYILKPINNDTLFELLEKIKGDIENEKLEEEKAKQYNNKLKQINLVLKEGTLQKLLKSNSFAKEDFWEETKKLGFEQNGDLYLSVIDMDNNLCGNIEGSEEVGKTDDLKEFIYKELNFYDESNIIVSEIDEMLIILIYIHSNSLKIKSNIIENEFEKFRKEITNSIGRTVTIGVSTCFHELKNIRDAYREALTAIEDRFYCGKNAIYFYKMEDYYINKIDTKDIDGFISSLVNAIELCSKEKIAIYVSKLFKTVQANKVEPKKVRMFLSNLILRIVSNNSDFKAVMDSKEKSFEFYINNIDTCLELRQFFTNQLQCYVNEINKMRLDRGMKIIEKAKEYINLNYRQEITLKDVADYVYLNPNYFSELFKNEVGENFIEYLIETRINASKKLLKRGDLKVYEVAEEVGYKEPVSFSRAFKKVVGISPKEYIQLVN